MSILTVEKCRRGGENKCYHECVSSFCTCVPVILSLCFSGTESLACGRDPNPQTKELSFVVLPLAMPPETTVEQWAS